MVAACFGPESSSAGEAGKLHDWLGTGQFLVTFSGVASVIPDLLVEGQT